MRKTISFLLAIGLIACGGHEEPSGTAPTAEDSSPAAAISVDLSGQGMPLLVVCGDASQLGVEAPVVNWNEEMGRMEIRAGEHFGLVIREEPGDIERLKGTLERDPLQTHEVIEEDAEHVIYRSQFPDDALVLIHFYRIVKAADREFIVQDGPEGRYNEADIQRMAGAVRTQAPV